MGSEGNDPQASLRPNTPQLALALTGGGARAAYQVGCLRYIAGAFPDFHPEIITGVSAGAINAAHLASSTRSMRDAVERLHALWLNIGTEQVYRVDARSLASHVLGWGARLVSGGRSFGPGLRGMVDTSPLRHFLTANLPHDQEGVLVNIANNLEQGRLNAVAISTTSYETGRSITWVQGNSMTAWTRRDRASVHTSLSIEHVMASAALPVFFPAVNLEGTWQGDGGIRLTAPLSPAVHLGATKVLAVSPRYLPPPSQVHLQRGNPYPTPARIAGVLMNSVFLDMLDHDELQMQRINELLRAMPASAHGNLRHVDVLILRPSRDLAALAGAFEVKLPKLFRFLQRGLGTRQTRGADALAMVMFEQGYLSRLVALGEEDASARHAEIDAFLHAPQQEGIAAIANYSRVGTTRP